ncbi:hypothetical protein [Actinoplanes sp. NPDC026623]|uniref:hypothetical protein n=1 Tax=Actinoplanes sp. NPDC026623 TaxID=3155610 RepID=UPI003407AF7E
MDRYRKWAWGLGIAAVTAVTAFSVASWQANAAPAPNTPPGAAAEQPRVSDPRVGPEPATGTGSDPLTSSEVERARKIAVTTQLKAGAKDVTGAAGPEYLSAEVDTDSAGRRAELYFYDYRSDKLIKQVVDLGTGKLAGSFSAAKMQPPASQREVAAALDILLADPLGADLKDAYRTVTGKELAGKAGLVADAHVYTADPADTGARQCGKRRCLQLVVQTEDGHFIDVNHIIIDLSGRTAARLK